MSADSDRMKAMQRQFPARIPVLMSFLPSAWIKYRGELEAVTARHPALFGDNAGVRRSTDSYDTVNGTYAAGAHTDVWGCVWSNIHHGQDAIVTGHPVPNREGIRSLQAPTKDVGLHHGFMFLRLTDLRGFEEAMIDFAEEPEELQMLIDTVADYNVRQSHWMNARLSADEPIVYVGDDLGTQKALPISPATWRKYLKPCYQRIYKPFLDAGRHVYMHTDGNILEIIDDLLDCGVEILNPQIRANGLDNLVETCKGRVCVCIDLDRQMFPFCTPKDIEEHVREVVMKLGSREGGLWIHCEADDGVPLENIEALCAAVEKYRGYFAN